MRGDTNYENDIWLYANGYTHVFLDEVHHAEKWQPLVKTIADSHR